MLKQNTLTPTKHTFYCSCVCVFLVLCVILSTVMIILTDSYHLHMFTLLNSEQTQIVQECWRIS